MAGVSAEDEVVLAAGSGLWPGRAGIESESRAVLAAEEVLEPSERSVGVPGSRGAEVLGLAWDGKAMNDLLTERSLRSERFE